MDLRERLQEALGSRYAIDRELGQGGMATVYLARDLKHNRPVALKVIHTEMAQTVKPRRFRREIELAAALHHPHILPVFDSGAAGQQETGANVLWYAMPYVKGPSLRELLRSTGPLSIDEALRITREAGQALAYAHREGIVHRDVKPENILLTEDGVTLVADFGIARVVGGTPDESLTRSGVVMGTPAYMAPEQATGEHPTDARADQYALAAVCYEMLTGEPPFTGSTAGAIIVARHTSPLPGARSRRPQIPVHTDEALRRALALTPEERFPSVREFVRAVTGGGAATPSGETAFIPPRRSRARRRAAVAGAAVALLAGGGILVARRAAAPAPLAPTDSAPTPRIAVLPFESIGGSDMVHVAEGVSDAVRGKLAQLPGIQVIARGSSIPYRGTREAPERIASVLGVRYILSGTVRAEPAPGSVPRVRVSPELVELQGNVPTVRWQAPFDAPLTDVFQVEARIAGEVVGALDLALSRDEVRRLAEHPTADPGAYEAFLKGEIASESRDLASVRRAAGLYTQAVGLDSAFGLAWARLARQHAVLYASYSPTPEEAAAAAQALERARTLDPDHPATWHARAIYHLFVENDPPRALMVLDSGLARWPQDVDLLGTAGAADRRPERVEQALARLRRARELDPRSVNTAVRFAYRLSQERMWAEAKDIAERGLTLAPTNLLLIDTRAIAELGEGNLAGAREIVARAAATPGVDVAALAAHMAASEDLFWLLDDALQRVVLELPPGAFDNNRAAWALVRVRVHRFRGDTAEARRWADSAQRELAAEIRQAPDNPMPRVYRGVALAFLGRSAEAVREGERGLALLGDPDSGVEGHYLLRQVALIHLLAGDREQAFARLEQLLTLRQHYAGGWLRLDPAFAPLRGERRFEELVGRAEGTRATALSP